jgi:putative DNA primase/helicase
VGKWYRWNGFVWSVDRKGIAFHWARELARQLSSSQDPRKRYITSRTSFARGVEKFAKHDPRVAVTSEDWDCDPFPLGTLGGTVDLRSGKLRVSRPDDGITKSTSVAPSEGSCWKWLAFLEEATGSDQELIRFLQQWCGYSLTGITREHALVFVYGPGGNGKSVFLNVITSIMRDYAATAAMDTFTASKSDKHPADLAMLRGARLVTASETEEGRAWAEARIKLMTGGDQITARHMRQNFFTFAPQFKLMIVGNHKPALHNIDEAARRRFNIVPFTVTPLVPDKDLEAKLVAESPAILQWMINGCLDWLTNGLIRPASVTAATNAYFSDQDLMAQWLEDCCEVGRGDCRIWDRSADLFDAWTEYVENAGEPTESKKAFGQSMQRRGFEPFRAPNGGARAFRFVRLKSTS